MKKNLQLIVFIFFFLFNGRSIAQSFTESFENVDSLLSNGWYQTNNSEPIGTGTWRQDNGNFTAHSGSPNSSIICDYSSVAGSGNISHWLFTPVINFYAGDTLFFWTRSYANNYYADRLEIRASITGATINVGNDQFSTGQFTELLYTINPTLDTTFSAYPLTWKKYTLPVSSVMAGNSGRIAFRYFVENGGADGVNGSTIALDDLYYKSNEPMSTQTEVILNANIFPNPASTFITVQLNTNATYTMSNLLGEFVSTGILNNGENKLDLSSYPSGIYLLSFFDQNQQIHTQRIIVN
jgi:hypothetical protein